MKEGWEYKTIKECCTELFAGGDVPKPDMSKNKTHNFTVPIYTNGVENEGLYGYTNNARVYEPAVTISARGTIGATFRRYTPFYPAIRLITAVPNKDLLSIDYLYFTLKTLTVGNSGTSIPQLTIPNIKNIVIPESIVDYLDSAFAKIDAMKANAEKALNEAKALFQASLKEMLEPKEGWEEKKLIKEFSLKSGENLSAKNQVIGPYPVYGGNGITGYHNQYNLSGDQILIGRVGALCGNIHYIKERIWVTDNAFVVNNIGSSWNMFFLSYELEYINLNQYASQTAQPVISNKSMKDVSIFQPPLSVQQSIVETLDSLKSKVDRLQENYNKISQECDALKQAILRQVFE